MCYTLICVGKLKEDYYKKLSLEYEKRLSAFCKPEIIEISAVRLSENPSEKEIAAALEKEGKSIMAAIPKNAYSIALCIEGQMLASEVLARKLERVSAEKSALCFIIGGSYGLAESVKKEADFKLSMSEMTFPHRLARIMLLEQLYRTFMIDRKYHK